MGKTGMNGSMRNERSLAQEEGISREYIKPIPVISTEEEEDIDQKLVAKDSQWLGISNIGNETMKSELGLSLLVSIVRVSIAVMETLAEVERDTNSGMQLPMSSAVLSDMVAGWEG